MKSDQIFVAYGQDPAALTHMLLEKAQLAGMIPKGALIGLKPNLVVGNPAPTGATTHPEILGAAIEYLRAHGRDNIIILEGSWVGENTKRAFDACGYTALARRCGVPLYDTKDEPGVTKRADGIDISVCKLALDVDFLINIPVLKGHCQTMVTGALKNLKGCITDREKRHFHALGLHRPIAALNTVLKSHFIIGDGICGDLDFEEGGNPVRMDRMFCGTDPVLIDSYIASSMGYAPEEIEYIARAARLGVGSMDIKSADIVELNRDESPARPTSSMKVRRLAAVAEQRQACSACYANLIQALARIDDAGLLSRFNKKHVCIGQGFRGAADDTRPGVGACCAAFAAHVGGCPAKTPDILEFLREQI